MNPVTPVLPTLIVNRPFMKAFLASDPPCCALGLVAVENQRRGFLALRTNPAIPSNIADGGLNFGHALYGNPRFETIQFGFEFYGYETYNVTINPNNPIAQAVMQAMIRSGDYFFFTVDEQNSRVTAFRSDIGQSCLTNLIENWERIQASTTTEIDYRRARLSFAQNPDPPGILMEWVCWEDINYLDLTQDYIALKPS